MKRLTTSLTILLFILFVGTTFYVFQLPPFFSQSTPDNTIQNPDDISSDSPSSTIAPSTENLTFDEHIKKGDTLQSEGFTEFAIREYQAANQIDPQSPIPYLKIGDIHFNNSNFEKSKISFESAIKNAPTNIDAQIGLARSLLGLKEISQATEVINNLPAEDQRALYYQGLIAIIQNDHDLAKNKLQTAINTNTFEIITSKSQKFLDAYKEFDSFQSGADSHLKTLLSRAFTESEEYNLAITELFEVIKLKNDYRDAWILLGYSYLKIEQPREAVDALLEAEKIDSQKPETQFFLGLAYLGTEDLDLAATHLETALENGFEPKVQAEQKLAEIYLLQEEFAKAADKYETVISLNDSDVDYFVRPIWIYLEQINNPAKAYALAQKAVTNHPQEAMSYNLLGWVNLKRNNLEVAEDNIKTALKINPDFDAAHLNLGQIYEQQNEIQPAKDAYQKAYELGNGNSISEIASTRFKSLNSLQANLLQ